LTNVADDRRRIGGVATGIVREAMTIIVVTHEMQLAREVADRVVFTEIFNSINSINSTNSTNSSTPHLVDSGRKTYRELCFFFTSIPQPAIIGALIERQTPLTG
jgi:hypothetical protein